MRHIVSAGALTEGERCKPIVGCSPSLRSCSQCKRSSAWERQTRRKLRTHKPQARHYLLHNLCLLRTFDR